MPSPDTERSTRGQPEYSRPKGYSDWKLMNTTADERYLDHTKEERVKMMKDRQERIREHERKKKRKADNAARANGGVKQD